MKRAILFCAALGAVLSMSAAEAAPVGTPAVRAPKDIAAAATAAVKRNDRAAFDAALAEAKALPPKDRCNLLQNLLGQMQRFDARSAREEAAAAAAAKDLSAAERIGMMAFRLRMIEPATYTWTPLEPGCDYETWRTGVKELIAFEDAQPPPKNGLARTWIGEQHASVAFGLDDLAFAAALCDRILARNAANCGVLELRARIECRRGDVAKGTATYASTLALRGTDAAQSNRVNAVCAFLRGEGLAGFDRAAAGLDALERLRLLRRTSQELFRLGRFDDCRTIFTEIETNSYEPFERRVHVATYLPNGPKTADAFARSPLYADWNAMETRFYAYGDVYGADAKTDETRHLKGVKTAVPAPEWRNGIRVTYDDTGVDVFVRCDTPEIDDVRLGRGTAGDVEIFFRPGGPGRAYRTIFFEKLPASGDRHAVEWASPGFDYSPNEDAVVKDAVLAERGAVLHVRFPWIEFCNDLPLDGNDWDFGISRFCKGGAFTIGGIVHELSRGLLIKFDFTPEQKADLKRTVSLMAFNRYDAVRQDWGGYIQKWADWALGDPAFYAAEVAPLLKRLDEAGAELLRISRARAEKGALPAEDAAKVERFYEEFRPIWAGIGYELARRRARYLRRQLFEGEDGAPGGEIPAKDVHIRDPFVVTDAAHGRYLLLSSHSAARGENAGDVCTGAKVYESADLVTFKPAKTVLDIPRSLDCRALWAPEMHRHNGKWYIFGTINYGHPKDSARGTWTFVADRPEGPFRPNSQRPITPPNWDALDGTLWVEDGKPHMVFCHEWAQITNGEMCVVQMTDDLTAPVGEPRTLFKATDYTAAPAAGAVVADHVTDGPFLYRSPKSGKLFMTWSNVSSGSGYVVILSESASGRLEGPWGNHRVIFRKDGGHGMIFRKLDGSLAFALHCPNSSPNERPKFFGVVDTGAALEIKE